ncbi:diguanylate cyclase [Romboutsia lituseburensis]|uniref:diguanylate cyclase n=1 Tax=Romboutsia lituseburensis TaxID=1537 RepID=UPI0022EB516B|nr:diguanylate cyclase [Romboutsia lituseburensis]
MIIYIELDEYDKAIEISKSINTLTDYLNKDVKDDVEILLYQNLASAYTYKKDLNKAELFLKKSNELLKYDEVEYIRNKDINLKIAYAQFYEEQGKYDEAIQIYEEILKSPLKNDFNIEVKIYGEIANIYLDKNDIERYIKYNNLATNKKDNFEDKLKDEYMKYASKLYESDKLREEQDKNIHNIIILLVSIIFLIIILISRINANIILKKSNFTDVMTNLYNRKYLDYYMKKNKKHIVNNNISVILTDIDYFKKYNDYYGHIKGDKVIKEVANSIIENIKNYGIAIRYGGEEIVIVLPNTNIDEAKIIANKIQSSISEKNIEHKHSNVSDKLTISMGVYSKVYLYNDNIYSIIDNADKALYKAKSNGKNRYEIH